MPFWFYGMGSSLVLLWTATAIGGVIASRRIAYRRKFIIAHGISGRFLEIVGILYSVLLGLIVVHTMIRFQRASRCVEHEVDRLRDVIFLSDGLSPEMRRNVRDLAIHYARIVPESEWQRLSSGEL